MRIPRHEGDSCTTRNKASGRRLLRALAVGSVLGLTGVAVAQHAQDESLRNLLAEHKERQQVVESELSSLGTQRAALQGELQDHARALYRLSRGGLLPLAGGIEALLTHASNLDRLQGVVKRDLAQLQKLRERGRALRAETAELASKVARTEASLDSVQQREAALAREQRAATEFEQAFATSRGTSGQTIRTSTGTLSVLDSEPAVTRFSEQRGTLALPVSGPSQVREATRAESDGSGLELVARAGVTVRASAPGRVAFADTYGSYGRIVILDHGQRYYTVYAGLGDVEVRVGDDLSRSARVGSVGDDGVLYFEVRKGTRNLPTRDWLGL